MNRIAVFASGSGTNAENIALYFKEKTDVEIVCFLTNNSDAYVIKRAEKLQIPSFIFSKKDFKESNIVIDYLKEMKVDFVVLAGFLWLLPENLIQMFPNRIVNIHPALLPKYGGKGMYGMNVHKAVVANQEKESGITIHMVSEKYDEGEIVFQAKCALESSDTPEDVAQKIHKLEYEHFPKVIEQLL
ncbi:phosphoribosylglycinamide formyltransferase [Marinifilum caeruleilacunae]|uniref:Phosphoribosylglycinamide formyltransferase n=1 Tax=Marinifilum caeruleilacunae TaxID=2499076 RepID=A0ABX1X0Q0_9BACT|nr:phosphoribosylglycinamide formyltransferase [Marinifilum caeruleilacunae]NOU61655.1 phosphoribosylglycinamide formyltransferase [Marinifilum caeruleilacunae]